jgi:hypothetical protein
MPSAAVWSNPSVRPSGIYLMASPENTGSHLRSLPNSAARVCPDIVDARLIRCRDAGARVRPESPIEVPGSGKASIAPGPMAV